MDNRHSKRSVKFGSQSDSEQPSDEEEEAPGAEFANLHAVESPEMDDQESEYDPNLDHKIEQIKLNLRSGGGSVTNSQAATNTQIGGTNSVETASHQKNVNKLEEVLKRQKERLEQIQGQF